jgi:shikimate dehydrogenase
MLNSQTALYCVIGDPVAHSLSPAMHNAAFRQMQLNSAYLALRVTAEKLRPAVAGLKALGICGFNVTTPHKSSILTLLDSLSPLAQQIGAVNTVVSDGVNFKGFNTDGSGAMQVLKDHGISLPGQRITLLGAGGAASAIAFAAAEQGARLTIFNRPEHLDKALRLAQRLERYTGQSIQIMALNHYNLQAALAQSDILINASSTGMGNEGATPVPAELLQPPLLVFDIVYNPLQTRLLAEAARAGCRTINGLAMLAAQAALSFELWTGRQVPAGLMQQAALEELQRQGVALPHPYHSSIALIGFMGSGKSAAAVLLAQRLGKQLTVIDELIASRAGKTIERIFAEDHEAGFRRLESEAIAAISPSPAQVIDCGGGVVLDPANIEHLKQHAVVVYLSASPDTLIQRLRHSYSRRPLLAGTDPEGAIRRLLQQRQPLYQRAADITVDTDNKTIHEVVAEIILKVKSRSI